MTTRDLLSDAAPSDIIITFTLYTKLDDECDQQITTVIRLLIAPGHVQYRQCFQQQTDDSHKVDRLLEVSCHIHMLVCYRLHTTVASFTENVIKRHQTSAVCRAEIQLLELPCR